MSSGSVEVGKFDTQNLASVTAGDDICQILLGLKSPGETYSGV